MVFPVSRRIINLYKGELLDLFGLLFKNKIIEGEYTNTFSVEFSKYVESKFVIPTSTGSMALYTILKSLTLPEGSEIIIPAYEDLSVPKTVREMGLVPVFSDINLQTQNIELKLFSGKVTSKTAAIIVTHLFGNPCNIEEIIEFAKMRRLAVIEDCAHALGSRINKKHVGNFGDAAFFSFHTTKPFMCFGGGAATTNSEELARKIQEIVSQLPNPAFLDIIRRVTWSYILSLLSSGTVFIFFTYPLLIFVELIKIDPIAFYNRNFKVALKIKKKETRFINLQEFIGIKNLKILEENLKIRKTNGITLDQLLNKNIERIKFQQGSNYYYFIILAERTEYIRRVLLKNGIDTGRAVMRNCPDILGSKSSFANTALAYEKSIQLPIHEKVSLAQVVKMAKILNKLIA
jgi:dTDP-4-amino-4,6-dideoxygalactose transaminase